MYLTEDQRNKLLKREELTPTERRDNEFAVRNKLKDFLEFVSDANLILSNLPKEQLKKNAKLADVLNDQTTYGLFDIIFQLLNLLDFTVAYGPLQKPYAIKESNYTGPFASKYEAPITWKAFEERERIEAKIYPKLKQMTPEEYVRILNISIYIQELMDNYLSDLILLYSIPSEIRPEEANCPHYSNISLSLIQKSGWGRLNARLIKALKDFGPIPENELMLKLFIDSSDLQKSKTFSDQLKVLEFHGIIRKEAEGWKWILDENDKEKHSQKKS